VVESIVATLIHTSQVMKHLYDSSKDEERGKADASVSDAGLFQLLLR